MTEKQTSKKQTSNVARGLIIGLAALALVVFAAGAIRWAVKSGFLRTGLGAESTGGEERPPVASGEGTQVFGVPEEAGPVAMEVPRLPPAPAIRAVVYDAALVKSTLEANPWLKDVLSKPLGRGFVGSWAGFLGTRGEDMHADFKGAIIDLLLDKAGVVVTPGSRIAPMRIQ